MSVQDMTGFREFKVPHFAGKQRQEQHLLKNEFLSEDGILALPRVRLSNLDVVQVDVTVGVGEMLHW